MLNMGYHIDDLDEIVFISVLNKHNIDIKEVYDNGLMEEIQPKDNEKEIFNILKQR